MANTLCDLAGSEAFEHGDGYDWEKNASKLFDTKDHSDVIEDFILEKLVDNNLYPEFWESIGEEKLLHYVRKDGKWIHVDANQNNNSPGQSS